mgnify:CR=1 FL=1
MNTRVLLTHQWRIRRRVHALFIGMALVALAAGPALAHGPAERAGVGTTLIINHSSYLSIAANSSDGVTAKCGNNFPTGGGFEIKDASVPFPTHIYRSGPVFENPNGWRSSAWNPKAASGPVRLRSYTLCLKRLSDVPSKEILYPTDSGGLTAATMRTVRAACASASVLPRRTMS